MHVFIRATPLSYQQAQTAAAADGCCSTTAATPASMPAYQPQSAAAGECHCQMTCDPADPLLLHHTPVQVTSTWAAEADAKRLAALAACMEAPPIPVVNIVPEESDEPEQQQRGRTGADSMAVDSAAAAAGKSSKKGKKRSAAAAAAAGGINKKKKKQSAGQKLATEFSKRSKKQRRARI